MFLKFLLGLALILCVSTASAEETTVIGECFVDNPAELIQIASGLPMLSPEPENGLFNKTVKIRDGEDIFINWNGGRLYLGVGSPFSGMKAEVTAPFPVVRSSSENLNSSQIKIVSLYKASLSYRSADDRIFNIECNVTPVVTENACGGKSVCVQL